VGVGSWRGASLLGVKVALVPEVRRRPEAHRRVPQRVANHFLHCIAAGLAVRSSVAVAGYTADGELDPQAAVAVERQQALWREAYGLPRPFQVRVEQPVGKRRVSDVIQMHDLACGVIAAALLALGLGDRIHDLPLR